MSLHSTIFCNFRQNRSFRRFGCKICTLPSFISFHCMIFCSFCQNPFFRHFCWCPWTPLMHYAMIALSNFFLIFIKIDEHFRHFCHFCWSLWSPSCHCAQHFSKIFCQNCFFSIFFGNFGPSHTTCHCTQQFFCNFRQNHCFCQFR